MFNIINHCAGRKGYGLTRLSKGSRIDEIMFASVTGAVINYPVTKKLSDAKVKRQVYKLALFCRGVGPYCVVG